jgi:hypothetical protein
MHFVKLTAISLVAIKRHWLQTLDEVKITWVWKWANFLKIHIGYHGCKKFQKRKWLFSWLILISWSQWLAHAWYLYVPLNEYCSIFRNYWWRRNKHWTLHLNMITNDITPNSVILSQIQCINQTNFRRFTRVELSITKHYSIIEHFFKSLLHFEWFQMLWERYLKL